jgi:hypothetical protein
MGKVKVLTLDEGMSGVSCRVNFATLDCLWFSDEAQFHFDDSMKKQSTRFWTSRNTHIFVEMSLHPVKCTECCEISMHGLTVPIFVEGTIKNHGQLQLLLPGRHVHQTLISAILSFGATTEIVCTASTRESYKWKLKLMLKKWQVICYMTQLTAL